MTGKGADFGRSSYTSKKYTAKTESQKLLMALFTLFALSASVGFATAPTINSASINDADYFYSSAAGNDIIHLQANITGLSGVAQANFSNVSQCGGSPVVNMTLNSGLYTASCNVSADAATSNFVGGGIFILAANSPSPADWANTTISPIILYNMTTPPSDPSGCSAFGQGTTDMSQVLNFSSVNFVIEMLINGSAACNGGHEMPWGNDTLKVMTMNFSSLDMANQSIGSKLAALANAINVTIAPPMSFGESRIYVKTSAF
ncbi:MAG TPA: hypothetical protein PLO51_05570, partial [Candidatus Micrarchaeota archaeon]|nr:hypothetical protein [Candidatus Micrarchaeota archaeon]